MDNNDDLYTHVKATIQKIRNRGDKPTPTLVVAEAKKNRQKTLKMFSKIMNEETQSKRDREASAISQDIGASILKDREERVTQVTASLHDDLERMEGICDFLHEELSSLQEARDGLEQRLTLEQETHSGQFNSLEQTNAQLNGTIQSMHKQEATLIKQLEAIEKQRDSSIEDHLKVNQSLMQRNEELKYVRTEAETRHKQLNDARGKLDKAQASQFDAEKASERLEGKLSAMKDQLKTLREEMEKQTRLRIEACTASAVAIDRLEDKKTVSNKSES